MKNHPETALAADGSLACPAGRVPADAIAQSGLELLYGEVKRSLMYYRGLFPEHRYEAVVGELLLGGGGAGLRGLDSYLAARLELPVELADPFGGIFLSVPAAFFSVVARCRSALLAAFGAALQVHRAEA